MTGRDSLLGNIGEIGGWINIAENILKVFSKGGEIYEKLPEQFKQKMPGFLGISLADEQIFNATLGDLDLKEQVTINTFLFNKCKDFQRNRFINIVAGMEVVPETPRVVEKKVDPKTKAESEKITDGKAGVDRRKQFLQKFAQIIITEFSGDLNKAYEFCLGGRMVLSDPFYQKALDAWTKSCEQYGKVLKFFGAESALDLPRKAKEYLEKELQKDPYRGFWTESLGFNPIPRNWRKRRVS
jgi:hypothetical protein